MSRTYYGTMLHDEQKMLAAIESYTWQMYVVITGNPFDGGLQTFGPFVSYEEARETLEKSNLDGWVSALGPRDLSEDDQ